MYSAEALFLGLSLPIGALEKIRGIFLWFFFSALKAGHMAAVSVYLEMLVLVPRPFQPPIPPVAACSLTGALHHSPVLQSMRTLEPPSSNPERVKVRRCFPPLQDFTYNLPSPLFYSLRT